MKQFLRHLAARHNRLCSILNSISEYFSLPLFILFNDLFIILLCSTYYYGNAIYKNKVEIGQQMIDYRYHVIELEIAIYAFFGFSAMIYVCNSTKYQV